MRKVFASVGLAAFMIMGIGPDALAQVPAAVEAAQIDEVETDDDDGNLGLLGLVGLLGLAGLIGLGGGRRRSRDTGRSVYTGGGGGRRGGGTDWTGTYGGR